MTYAPWRTDRPLDARLVETVVTRQCPGLRPVTATLPGAGRDSEVFLVYGSGLLEGSPGDGNVARRYVEHAFPRRDR